jgi:hypothetical protein
MLSRTTVGLPFPFLQAHDQNNQSKHTHISATTFRLDSPWSPWESQEVSPSKAAIVDGLARNTCCQYLLSFSSDTNLKQCKGKQLGEGEGRESEL